MAEAVGEITFDMAGARQGALNILRNCAHVTAGDCVLIVGESGGRAFFDPQVCKIVADAATSIGAHAEIVIAPETTGPEEFPASISKAMRQADHDFLCQDWRSGPVHGPAGHGHQDHVLHA